jgi:predicted transcriptional regulator
VSKRGNKTSSHTRSQRKERVIELAQAGATKQEIATEIGISRQTLWRYLQALDVQFVESNHDAITALKQKVAGEIAQRADEVLAGDLDPKAATAWNGLMLSFNKLLGLNAPSKSIQAHVSANLTDRDLKLRKATHGLDEDQLESVAAFARSLPRKPAVRDASWFPTPEPALLEGGSDD